MATLADVNQQLLAQNDTLESVDKGITKLSSSLSAFVSNLMEGEKSQKLRDLEASREDQASRIKVEKQKADVKQSEQSGDGLFGGLLGKLGQLFTVGGLAGAAASVFTGILKKVPFIILNALADDIANYIGEEFDLNGDSRIALRNALKLGTLGALINKRFAAIGFAAGLFWNKEAEEAFKEFFNKFDELKEKYGPQLEQISKDLAEYGINLDLLLNPLEAIASGLTGGLEGLDALISGEAWKDLENAGDFAVNMGGLVGALVGIYALLRPLSALGLLWKTGKLGGKGLKSALKFVFGVGGAAAAADMLTEADIPTQTTDTTPAGEAGKNKPKKPTAKPKVRGGRLGLGGALGLGLTALFFSDDVGTGSDEVPKDADGKPVYKFLDDLEKKTSDPLKKNFDNKVIEKAEILAKEASIRVELIPDGNRGSAVYQDNSSTVVGGSTNNSMVLPPSSPTDSRDPVSRD